MRHLIRMKESNILLIVAILFLFVGSSFSQNDTLCLTKAQIKRFAPVGAQWYYETQSLFSTGYLKMEVEKDTVINGTACIKFVRERHWHDLIFDELHGSMLPPLFLSQVGDVVMVYHKDSFLKLFDFGAGIGDSWMVPGQEGVCEEDFGSVRVVGKGVEMHNGIELKYMLLVDETFSYWGFSPTFPEEPSDTIKVLERIGPIGSYLLPEQKCLFDDVEGGPIRCYIDGELGELHLTSLYPERNCDYISETYQGVDEQNILSDVSISPNPCENKICVRFNVTNLDCCEMTILDALGKLVFHGSFNEKNAEINIDGLPSGLYCLIVKGGCKVYSKTFIKK